MKTLAQSLFATLLLSTTTFASPAPTTPTNAIKPLEITTTTSSYKVAVYPSSVAVAKLNVVVERQPGQSMIVSLKNSEGAVIGTQLIGKKQGTFRFQFDLADLQDGNYVVEVVSGNDKTVRPVTLSTQPAQQAARTIALN
jgi:hypothetical protein